MSRMFTIVLLVVAGALAGFMAARSAWSGGPPTKAVRIHGNSSLSAAQHFSEYPLYYVGKDFGGLPLVAVDHQAAPIRAGELVGTNRVTFDYGECEIRTDIEGDVCSPPLAIQIWPACMRYQALYPMAPDESLRVRGAPAAFYENYTRLEVYMGKISVVMFGLNKEQLIEAAKGLRPLAASHATGDLPQPVAGAQAGRLMC